AREHEPAPGEKLREAGDAEREGERPKKGGQVALGVKDARGEGGVEEGEGNERPTLGRDAIPVSMGEGDNARRGEGRAREDGCSRRREAPHPGAQTPVLVAGEEGARCQQQEGERPDGRREPEGGEGEHRDERE